MKTSFIVESFLIFCAVASLCMLNFCLGRYGATEKMRAEAISHGVAHYEATDDGKAVFVWETNENPLTGY